MHDISSYFASSRGHKDQQPNIDLANQLVKNATKSDIVQLLNFCICGTKTQKSDAIKVIYELAKLQEDLLIPHIYTLIKSLEKADNRMIWGILQALSTLTDAAPEIIIKNLNEILAAADRSSVIAKDNMMAILTKLSTQKRFADFLMPVILQRLEHSAPNQFPTYAQLVEKIIDEKNKNAFIDIIIQRQKSIALPAKQKRLNKILQKLGY